MSSKQALRNCARPGQVPSSRCLLGRSSLGGRAGPRPHLGVVGRPTRSSPLLRRSDQSDTRYFLRAAAFFLGAERAAARAGLAILALWPDALSCFSADLRSGFAGALALTGGGGGGG